MIRVTQGHENGIGLEIFIKAFICLPKSKQDRFLLYCDYSSLQKTLDSIQFDYQINGDQLTILANRLPLKQVTGQLPQTSLALYDALSDMGENDILLTLPSSKDQIVSRDGKAYRGHTDLLRSEFTNSEVVMTFVAPKLNVALLTDHIALGEIEAALGGDQLVETLKSSLKGFKGIRDIRKVYVAGVNPHCGEGGIISEFDRKLERGLEKVSKLFPRIQFKGLIPGDTILFNPADRESLFVFTFHDQGLGPFKYINGLTGINLTLGLPFRRVSVDHGTAFDLYGKNEASYQGMIYLLDEILEWN